MITGFNADCIVLRFYLFRIKNVSKQFRPQEEAGVRFICVEICLFQSCFVVPVGFENRSQNKKLSLYENLNRVTTKIIDTNIYSHSYGRCIEIQQKKNQYFFFFYLF